MFLYTLKKGELNFFFCPGWNLGSPDGRQHLNALKRTLLVEGEPLEVGVGVGWVTTEMCFHKGAPRPVHPTPLHGLLLLIAVTERKADIVAGKMYNF